MSFSIYLILLIAIPVMTGILLHFQKRPRVILIGNACGVALTALTAIMAAFSERRTGPLEALNDWLFLDALSAFHILVLAVVYLLASLYAIPYFTEELHRHRVDLKLLQRFGLLWPLSMATMMYVLLANHIAFMWIALETTTLLTAFLIAIPVKKESLEAMWKYLIICSVAITIGFAGIVLIAGNAQTFLWTDIREIAHRLNPTTLKIAFIIILVGFGAKAGLAPMHTWLPDAHGQAPAPVSAIFSGFMINTALYAILRFIPIVEGPAANAGLASQLVQTMGLISILVAGIMLLYQNNLKRFFAYCSVEHIGIIAIGIGFGPAGIFASLFHTINHSLCKILSFFATGRVGQSMGSYDISKLHRVVRQTPLWGAALIISMLALMGMVPFSLFASELLLVRAGLNSTSTFPIILFLIMCSLVFFRSAHILIRLIWTKGEAEHAPPSPIHLGPWDLITCAIPVVALLTLTFWMPAPLLQLMTEAARVLQRP